LKKVNGFLLGKQIWFCLGQEANQLTSKILHRETTQQFQRLSTLLTVWEDVHVSFKEPENLVENINQGKVEKCSTTNTDTL
jgi:hypothetical protein